MGIDRDDLVLAAQALEARAAGDADMMAAFAVIGATRLPAVAERIRHAARDLPPADPVFLAAAELVAIARPIDRLAQLDELQREALLETAGRFRRLAGEPPQEVPRNRAERRAMCAGKGRRR